MQMIGKKSLASILKVMLNIVFYVSIIAEFFIIVTFTVILIAGKENIIRFLTDSGIQHLTLESSALSITFKEGFPVNMLPGLLLTALGIVFIICLIEILIVFQLRKIFETLIGKNPFILINAGRIRVIGGLVIAGSLIYSIFEFIIFNTMIKYFTFSGLDMNIHFSIDWKVVFLGLVFFILAEVFRIGSELQDEKNLTI